MTGQGNICIRCGKKRVVAKTWTETIKTSSGTSLLTHILSVCPDAACQKKVEQLLAKQKQLSLDKQRASEERSLARLAPIAQSHLKVAVK